MTTKIAPQLASLGGALPFLLVPFRCLVVKTILRPTVALRPLSMAQDGIFRRTWALRGRLRDYHVILRTDLRSGDEVALDPVTVSMDLDFWLHDPVFGQTLLEIWESTSLFPLTQARLLNQPELVRFLKPRLEEMFLHGPMVLVRVPKTLRCWGEPVTEEEEERPVRPAAAPRKELTWIEIELVDEKGKPVPAEAYSIELPDGTLRTGSLDAHGRARVDQIDPGMCKVTFPKIDGREWRRA
jgi:hypothetical protein